MTTGRLNQGVQAYKLRIQEATLQITDTMLTDADTSQSFDFAAALPSGAYILGAWIDVDEEITTTPTDTAASKTAGIGPYNFAAADTMVLDVDDVGNATTTWDAAAGTQECTTYFPVSDLDGLTLNVSHDGGANELVTFATPCTTEAHVTAQIASGTTGLSTSAATTAKAAFIPTNTEDAPYTLITDGLTAIIDVDDAGADTATWNIAQAVSAGSGLTIVDIDTETLLVEIDDGAAQTITFGAGDVSATVAAATINTNLVGGRAVVNGAEIDIYSDKWGTGSAVNITGGTAAAELGQAVADNAGTGDAVDGSAVTIAEIKTWLEGDITGSSGIVVADIGSNRFSITSGTTGVDSEIDIQASTAIAELGLATQIVIGTAAQTKLTSDTAGTGSAISVTDVNSGLTWGSAVAGTGDVVSIDAVTAAECKTIIENDTTATVTVNGNGSFTIISPTTGSSSELDFKSGNALAVLTLSVEVIVGVDAVVGTATADVGISGGDTDALLDGVDVTTATGIVQSPQGATPAGIFSAETVAVKVDGSVNLNTMTQGDITCYVLYHDTSPIE